MLLDEVFDREIPSADAIKFTFAFARMEYALKRAGFARVSKDGHVLADWDSLAAKTADLESGAAGSLERAIAYLYEQPPMVERSRGGNIKFESVEVLQHSNHTLYLMVRRVRNNLFHGGKLPYRDRDECLVRCGNVILSAILDQKSAIASHFASHFA